MWPDREKNIQMFDCFGKKKIGSNGLHKSLKNIINGDLVS